MKRTFLFLALLSAAVIGAQAQQFEDYFEDRTLRLDYTFSGNSERQELYVDELVALPRWYGKRRRLAEVPLKGNGQLTVNDKTSGRIIYRHSFSTLFQEWLATEESRRTPRSFENTFLVPFPKQPVDITVELWDYHMQTTARLTHSVDPRDILIRKASERLVTPYVTLQQAADTARCIHIAYVAEGCFGLSCIIEDGRAEFEQGCVSQYAADEFAGCVACVALGDGYLEFVHVSVYLVVLSLSFFSSSSPVSMSEYCSSGSCSV